MNRLLEKEKTGSIRRWPVVLLAAALVVSVSAAPNSNKTGEKKGTSAPSVQASPVAKLKSSLLDMPLAFEANKGQTDSSVKFLTRAQNFIVFLSPNETVVRGRKDDVLRMQLRNANQSPKLVGEDKQLKVTNYFIGSDRSKWLKGVENFGQVRYQDVYSGIDMVYHSNQRQLEYDFVVKPGADLNQIQVAFQGTKAIAITADGELKLTSDEATSLHHKPLVYQMINGKRQLVHGEYTLASNLVGFKVGQYDRTQPLIIDPTLQVLSFFGGTSNDEAAAIATSATQASLTTAGVVFVGRAESPNLPGAGGALSAGKPTAGLSWDAFATGLNPGTAGIPAAAGNAILWTTYFGGSGDDAARGVAMDNQGNVYVTGYTNSSNFITAGGANTASAYDAFLVKMSASGGSISASTLYGGPGVDMATSIALDYSTFSKLANASSITSPATDPRVTPNVVIGGLTSGQIGQTGSPAFTAASGSGSTPDGNQTTFNIPQSGAAGTTDGFVAIFNPTLQVVHATYIGGGGNDQVNGVAVDIWGNIYATGYATPNVPALIPPATVPTFFPVVNGIGNAAGTQSATFDAARTPQGAATAFVAKWTCTTGTSPNGPIGVTSPPFGVVNGVNSQFPICGGTNNLKTLSNSALFGGSARGNTFINPEQVVNGLPGITEAGFGIAVDQNGWGQAGVTSVAARFNNWGLADIVPNEPATACNTGAVGNLNTGVATNCAVTTTGGTAPMPPGNTTTNAGGFQPGLSGPHVYVVGATASRDFVNGLISASCTAVPAVSVGGTPVPPLCDTPQVWGGVVQATSVAGVVTTTAPVPACDIISAALCPATVPVVDLKVSTVANGASNSGQTQGWLAAFQFPAVTTEVVTPPGVAGLTAPTTTVNTLSPPTIPNYIVLQPLTCPAQVPGAPGTNLVCIPGSNSAVDLANNNAIVANAFGATSAAPAVNFGCTNGGAGITCPAAFIGSWNAVAVDSDMQVYVVGQLGLPSAARGTFNPFIAAGAAPSRLAMEIERVSPYSQTSTFVAGGGVLSGLCSGAPCAFPEPIFNASSSYLVDTLNGGSTYGAILPGAPPRPDPNQPGGVGNGIAVNPLREAFFVGTTTATNGANGTTATATAAINAAGQVQITVTNAGAGYTTAPTLTLSGLTSCTTTPGPFTVTITGGVVTAIANNPSGAGCIAAALTVSFTAAPGAGFPLTTGPVLANPIAPVPATQRNLGSTGGSNGSTAPATEDVIYGAIQFYDAIASPSVVNFTSTVNSVPSIFGPNSVPGDLTTTGVNAKAFVTYTNWEGQVLNIPPGCTITPIFNPAVFNIVQLGNTAVFQVSVAAGAVGTPGVISNLVVFVKNGPCTGAGQPALDSWDPITVTLTNSAPLNVTSEDTFGTPSNPLTSGLLTGLIDQFVTNGHQLAANQQVTSFIDVATAATPTNAPINFTVQIVPGVNWAGAAVNAVTVPTPTDIIYEANGTGVTRIPVTFNTLAIGQLPQGTYSAYILVTPTPETPALGSPGSLTCGATIVGTSNATCVPVVIKVGPSQSANIPGALVFGSNATTPQQTGLTISNPVNSPSVLNFTTFYQPTPVVGTALPAANVFYVGTGSTLTSAIGNTVAGTVSVGGTFTIPIQVNPVGLPTGIYSGQLLVSNTALVTGATAQMTVPLIVYVGPKTGEDLPFGNGLGLLLPVNVPPIGTGALPGSVSQESPGAYGLTLNVASGFGPTQTPNPTLIEVTGLNNTLATPYAVNPPVVLGPNKTGTLPGVSVTNATPGQNNFGTVPAACTPTFAQQSSLPGSPLGPPCVFSVWVDATTLNVNNTTRTAACGIDPVSQQPQFGQTGWLRFTQVPNGTVINGNVVNALPFATFDVPLTVCVSDEPALIVGMPQTFPNPTFGPLNGLDNFIAQPSNLGNGFTLSLTEMQIAASTGSSNGSTSAPIQLFAQQFNSGFVCKTLDIHTNGGTVPGVTINPLGTGPGQFLTVSQAPALFLGALPSLAFPFAVNGLLLPGTPPFAAGPFTVGPGMQTFQVCANTDPIGNRIGTFTQNLVINGGQVGPITLPINFTVGPTVGGPVSGPAAKFSQIGIFRNGLFVLDANGNNTFDLPADKLETFGQAGDIPVAGDWDGTGIVRIGVYRPSNGHWYLDLNNNGKWDGTASGMDLDIQFGAPSATCVPTSAATLAACQDIPVVGDWNGSGVSKLGIFRGGLFFLDNQAPTVAGSHTSFTTYSFGMPGDIPVAANWNGIGTADQIGVYRRGTWYVNATGDGVYHASDPVYNFGSAGDIPVVGNWNGTGPKRIGVFNANGQWYLDLNGDHVFSLPFDTIANYGQPGDLPVVGGPYTLP